MSSASSEVCRGLPRLILFSLREGTRRAALFWPCVTCGGKAIWLASLPSLPSYTGTEALPLLSTWGNAAAGTIWITSKHDNVGEHDDNHVAPDRTCLFGFRRQFRLLVSICQHLPRRWHSTSAASQVLDLI